MSKAHPAGGQNHKINLLRPEQKKPCFLHPGSVMEPQGFASSSPPLLSLVLKGWHCIQALPQLGTLFNSLLALRLLLALLQRVGHHLV